MTEKRYCLGRFPGSRSNGHARAGKAFLTWTFADGNFSASAHVWDARGNDHFMGGQCLEEVCRAFPNDAQAQSILDVWKKYHLNDMRAGCEHQRAEGWNVRPIDPSKPTNAYGKHFPGQRQDSWNMLAWVTRDEHPEGLLSHPCPTCGYKYGSAWLKEELPPEIVATIESWIEREASEV